MRTAPAGSRDVLAFLDRTIEEACADPAQQTMLRVALVGLRRQFERSAQERGWIPALDLPLACFAAVAGEGGGALPLAAIASSIFLGLDVFDDLADGDERAHWQGYSPGEITLAAVCCAAVLPQRLLLSLPLPPERLLLMQRLVSEAFLRMSAGQQADLAMTASPSPDPAAVEASVLGKSGDQFALYCQLAALAAGASEARAADFAVVGRGIGVAAQLGSDCYELFHADFSRDLAAGTRTLPVAWQLRRLEGRAREEFLALLEAARRDRAAQLAVAERLRTGGALRYTVFIAELHRQRALAGLNRAQPLEPAAARLRDLIQSVAVGGVSAAD